MPKITYIDKKFRAQTLKIIDYANEIINEYMADGLQLTLRQLYYQFVARGLIPNSSREYNRLGNIIGDARLAGLIDWLAIEDRTRQIHGNSHWRDPAHIMKAVRASFMIDHWQHQEYRVEVWIEKEALSGVISQICHSLDVDYLACKGYVSLSEMWNAAERLNSYGQTPVIIHLGDHDPSGIDMTRDIQDRQKLFENYGLVLKRIALNMDQIEEYAPPPNPAKFTDSRCSKYVSKYGYESWELDALEPRIMWGLIEKTVLQYRDDDIYQDVLNKEAEYLNILSKI